MDDRYRGVYNERRVVFMHQDDMKTLGLEKEDIVNLQSNYDGIKREAYRFKIVPYDIPAGNIAAYFPETNPLVPHNHFAERSRTPISKSIKVRIEKVG
jgi:anaerobic selenocysteine-containing dehydrogenase